MTLLYSSPQFLEHETGPEVERAERIRHLPYHLRLAGLWERCTHPTWQPVSRTRLATIHSLDYIDSIRSLARNGGGAIEEETYVSPASFHVALLAVGAVCDATQRVVAGEDRTALCLVRPPGHHAGVDRAGGFCIFNNVAVAAFLAVEELALARVLIVDWDVHHGNGTQDLFWEDPRVGFFSIHRFPFYPDTGAAEEIGFGPGTGTTCNLPIRYGTSREDFLHTFQESLTRFAAHIEPQLVFISAGFDAHREDPVGDLGLEVEDFAAMTQMVRAVAGRYAAGRVVSVLEGGYNAPVLASCVETHLRELLA